ncbi:MAG: HIT domain-containing protein [Candidatus Schekmanbacteria bacterium]|nr:HIT domain-containing protein [Candidatus Schekmanbacteria bacterium]
MERLWAPWRMEYILSDKITECAFCQKLTDKTHHYYILELNDHGMVIMNIYPYNSGHLLVVPRRHVADLEELDENELITLTKMQVMACRRLKEALHPQGLNMGINLGRIAGAGIAQHLHWHIVPRWSGDVNFMPIMTETRVISQHLEETYNLLKPFFAAKG